VAFCFPPSVIAERYTVVQWADIRGVTEDAVRSNVNSAREKLLAEEDRESVE
jgi:DNA-directed RNA polymerase specialized sigma24 family protein